MKKITTLLSALLVSASLSAQCDSVKTVFYSSVGISVGHVDKNDVGINNFNKASYPSVEIGLMRKSISLGAVFGHESFRISSPENRYYYELKTTAYQSIQEYNIYLLFGVGAYFEKEFNNFIEYGAGFSFQPKKLGYFVQYSSWARTNYISVGVSYCFN